MSWNKIGGIHLPSGRYSLQIVHTSPEGVDTKLTFPILQHEATEEVDIVIFEEERDYLDLTLDQNQARLLVGPDKHIKIATAMRVIPNEKTGELYTVEVEEES